MVNKDFQIGANGLCASVVAEILLSDGPTHVVSNYICQKYLENTVDFFPDTVYMVTTVDFV